MLLHRGLSEQLTKQSPKASALPFNITWPDKYFPFMERTALLHCWRTLGVTKMTSKYIKPTILVFSPKHLAKKQRNKFNVQKDIFHSDSFAEGRRFELFSDKLPYLLIQRWRSGQSVPHTLPHPNVDWVQILNPAFCVGYVLWFSSLLQWFISGFSVFPSSQKKQHENSNSI